MTLEHHRTFCLRVGLAGLSQLCASLSSFGLLMNNISTYNSSKGLIFCYGYGPGPLGNLLTAFVWAQCTRFKGYGTLGGHPRRMQLAPVIRQ